MGELKIRKLVTYFEETRLEQSRPIVPPTVKGAAGAVIANPYAGCFDERLAGLADFGETLGALLCDVLLKKMAICEDRVEGYGKAAIVGSAGEIEHAAAIIHPKFGKSVRQMLTFARTLMPSVTKRAGVGARVDVPLHSTRDEWSFDHFDTVTFGMEDAPGPDEILIILALASSGRPIARTRPI